MHSLGFVLFATNEMVSYILLVLFGLLLTRWSHAFSGFYFVCY